jgi:DNA-binding transcriptional LysR family regulator
MRALNPDHLQTFVEVVERGSFSAASQRLHLTQPAVSQQVRELERRLGVQLIERVGKRAFATVAGMELMDHARHLATALSQAAAAMALYRREVIGRVRLGTGATACIYLLPAILRRLHQRYPKLEIVVTTGNTEDIVERILKNRLDVALVTLPVSNHALSVTPVLDDELVAIFPTDGAKAPKIVSAAALSAWPVVLFEPGGNARGVVDSWFVRAGGPARPTMELGSVEAIKRLVAAGLGCGVLPRIAVANEQRQKQLRVRSLSPRLHRKLGIVRRRDKPIDRGLGEVIGALQGLKPRP